MAATVKIYAYPGSDTWEHLTSKVTRPDKTVVPVIWSEYARISLGVYEDTPKGVIGAKISSIDSVVNSELFRAPALSEVLQINTSKLPGIVVFQTYECLLKVHDSNHPDGQVIANQKEDSDKITLLLTALPG